LYITKLWYENPPRFDPRRCPVHNTTCTFLSVCSARAVRHAMHEGDWQRVSEILHSERDQGLIHILSTYPCSQWLNAVPAIPSIRLDDQPSRAMHASSWGCVTSPPWLHCEPVPVVIMSQETMLHMRLCAQPNLQARHDATADCLRAYAAHLGFFSSREGPYMRRGSCTTNRPAGTYTATSGQGLDTTSQMSHSSTLWHRPT
jgi:hypothetical protein